MCKVKKKEKRTRQDKQDNPVHNQHRPEDRNIKHGEPCTNESNGNSARRSMPELEFGKSTDERTEFIILLRRETR